MRKNGVNREIRAVSGGLCAPDGFQVSGFSFVLENSRAKGAALVVSERCPLAIYAPEYSVLNDCAPKDGMAQVLFLQTGSANLCLANAKTRDKELKRDIAKALNVEEQDVLFFSLGDVCVELSLSKIKEEIDGLSKGLTSLDDEMRKTLSFGRAFRFSYAFDLGDFACKIGGVASCSKTPCVGATRYFCLLSTDVNISPKLLNRAFSVACRDTLGLLGTRLSPLDGAVIISSQQAENCLIDVEDIEYKKFVAALTKVCGKIAKNLAVGIGERLMEISVNGGKSKQTVRALAKTIVEELSLKRQAESCFLTELIFAAYKVGGKELLSKADIRIRSIEGEICLMEDGAVLPHNKEYLKEIFTGEKLGVEISLKEGNFSVGARVRV